jgi:hypothetical protein
MLSIVLLCMYDLMTIVFISISTYPYIRYSINATIM